MQEGFFLALAGHVRLKIRLLVHKAPIKMKAPPPNSRSASDAATDHHAIQIHPASSISSSI
jgi:hypothetical protein